MSSRHNEFEGVLVCLTKNSFGDLCEDRPFALTNKRGLERGGGGVVHASPELKSIIHGSRELKQTFHESRTIQRLL